MRLDLVGQINLCIVGTRKESDLLSLAIIYGSTAFKVGWVGGGHNVIFLFIKL